jgi:hypothetical protein
MDWRYHEHGDIFSPLLPPPPRGPWSTNAQRWQLVRSRHGRLGSSSESVGARAVLQHRVQRGAVQVPRGPLINGPVCVGSARLGAGPGPWRAQAIYYQYFIAGKEKGSQSTEAISD